MAYCIYVRNIKGSHALHSLIECTISVIESSNTFKRPVIELVQPRVRLQS